jgi:eukaryotic-like serine/threonine-protein kinase
MQGTKVGNYEVTSQIGLGGMGVVYLARHVMLDRPAAIKVLRADMSHNRDIVTRFFNEARAATAIRHPGIVEIYDFGYLPDESAYIVMEYLDGESLSQRLLRMGRLPVGYAVAVTRQIASALQAAHAAQIIHRDLKPENVIILPDAEQACGDRIKLLDFGIAKLAATSAERSQTRTGEVIGTPTFMSPEQCRGAGKVDARSDLYSLGCLLYVLLCGRPPFEAEGAGDIIAHHLYFPPEPPSKHEPSIPVGVEQLILWLLQKEPAARPSTAIEVMEAIDRLGPSLSASLSPPPSLSRPGFPVQKAVRPAVQVASNAETTLSGSASQVRAVAAPDTVMVRPRPRWLVPAALGGVATLGIAAALIFGGGSSGAEQATAGKLVDESAPARDLGPAPATVPEPDPVPAPVVPRPIAPTAPTVDAPLAAPPQVEHVLESNPPGARVLVDDKQLGVTPFRFKIARAAEPRIYVLRAPGFLDATVTLSSEADARHTADLRKKPSSPPPPKKKPGGGYNPFE